MLAIKAVRFQNCFSFGNTMTEIRLDNRGPTLVVGKNGAGKSSSILDTLVYGLFGKPHRNIKNSQMINSITGRDLLVEVDFQVRGSSWTVRRGQKPAVFEVYKDGQLVDQAASVKDQQEWLEKSVLRIDRRSFVQTVILGTAKHVPFMQLPAAQRREVVEDILDIQVFSHMNDVLKSRAGELKDRLTEADRELSVVQRELEVEERHVESMRRDVDRERQELLQRAKDMFSEKERIDADAAGVQDLARSLSESVSDAEFTRSRIDDVNAEVAGHERDLSRVRRMLDFFTHQERCPTCRQDLSEELRAAELDRCQSEVARLASTISSLSSELESLEARMREVVSVEARVAAADRDFVRLKAESRSLETRLREVYEKVRSLREEGESDAQLVEDLRAKVSELSSVRDSLRTDAGVMATAAALLKDQGIKARIVAQYVPLMNRLVNKYLAALELFVDFHLDENFNEEIRSRNRDSFSYESFSEGERLRIDLAILFAWREIARMRNSSAVDLLIFDEILDSSLDADGIDYFLRVTRDVVGDTNVFIISHRDGVEDKFDSVLTFTKRNNFSSVRTGSEAA